MAGRDMVGANCGTDNPMMQMVKHFTQDKARAAELGQLGGRPQPGMVRARTHICTLTTSPTRPAHTRQCSIRRLFI